MCRGGLPKESLKKGQKQRQGGGMSENTSMKFLQFITLKDIIKGLLPRCLCNFLTFFPFLFPVLFISILAFCAAGCLILSDNRRQLLHSVQLYQPSFLYAYLAIFMQGGVIQVRMSYTKKLFILHYIFPPKS